MSDAAAATSERLARKAAARSAAAASMRCQSLGQR